MVQNLLKTMYKYVVDQEGLKRQKLYQERYNKLNKEYYDKEMQYALQTEFMWELLLKTEISALLTHPNT